LIIDVELIYQYAKKHINAMKQNAPRTGLEQAADLARVFPNITALHHKVTFSNVNTKLHPLKLSLTPEFDQVTKEGILNLPSNKRNALIDFLTVLPETMQQACTRRGIIHVFHENGMLDKYIVDGKVVSSHFPDSDKTLPTSCQTNLTIEEYALCERAFFLLLGYFLEHGHIPDSEFEDLGFLPDLDSDGIERRSEAGIECEFRKRVKNLTHLIQVKLRKKKLAAIAAEATCKIADSKKKIKASLALNKKCEEIIINNGGHLMSGSLKSRLFKFKDLKNDLCKALLQVRDPMILVSKLPKKGKVDNVTGGPPNLIQMVHEYRKQKVVVRVM
jgi:hypothetical protein